MASYVPAKSCKVENACGSILPGRDADFIVLDPDMSLAATYLNGESRYEA
jgi:N-acetylglucosamine-6-phosphate deacetylase